MRLYDESMRALISGASGLIGTALTERLLARGDEVVHLVRRQPSSDGVVSEVQWDSSDAESIDLDALGSIDAVFNFSGATVAHRWSESYKKLIYSSRIGSTATLVNLISRMDVPPSVFITAGGMAFYGDRGDEQLNESSPPGKSFLASVAVPWEAEAARASDFGCRTMTARFGAVLTARGGPLLQLTRPFRLGLGGRLGNGRQWSPWVHLDDTIEALIFISENNAFEGPVNVASPGVVRNIEMVRAIGEVLRRPAIGWMPAIVAKLAFGEYMQELGIDSALAIPEKLLQSEFQFKYPDLRECLRQELLSADSLFIAAVCGTSLSFRMTRH